MKIFAATALVVAGLSAGSAFARGYERLDPAPIERVAPGSAYGVPLGGVDGRHFDRCIGDSASEGNANQQNFPAKQYGQTAGGPLC